MDALKRSLERKGRPKGARGRRAAAAPVDIAQARARRGARGRAS
jgi:hypothetical protein